MDRSVFVAVAYARTIARRAYATIAQRYEWQRVKPTADGGDEVARYINVVAREMACMASREANPKARMPDTSRAAVARIRDVHAPTQPRCAGMRLSFAAGQIAGERRRVQVIVWWQRVRHRRRQPIERNCVRASSWKVGVLQ